MKVVLAFMRIDVGIFMVKEVVFISIGANDNAVAPDVEAVKGTIKSHV